MSKKRTRKNRVVFYLNDEELQALYHKMNTLGIKNREALIRKLTLDGYIVNINMEPIINLVRLVRICSDNINQITHRANESGSPYENDVLELLDEVNKLKPLVNHAHSEMIELCKK
jgi:hypothetical protein